MLLDKETTYLTSTFFGIIPSMWVTLWICHLMPWHNDVDFYWWYIPAVVSLGGILVASLTLSAATIMWLLGVAGFSTDK